MPADYAKLLAVMYAGLAQGAEERMNGVVEEVTGRAPMRLREFVEGNREVWG